MEIHTQPISGNKIVLSKSLRIVLLLIAIAAAIGPNGIYLHALMTQPELNARAMANPVAQAFMIEAMMLLALFLWYVFKRTGSLLQVLIYLVLAFLGSLAFSFPMFLYFQSESSQS
ncbi:MAG: DUF2834 domain-containing protein [Leptospiraceae bacterium]